MNDKDLLTVKEAAPILRISGATLKRYIRDGKLSAIKMSSTGPIKIYRYEIDRFIRASETNRVRTDTK